MRILILSPGADTGGQGYRIYQAFKRLEPTWKVDAVHASDNYMRFPSHLRYDADTVQRLYDAADVVHHKNGLMLYARHDNGQRKPTVLHHQGSRLRGFPKQVSNEGRSVGATQLVSTIDLLDDCPGAQWLPSPFDLDWLRDRYRVRRRGVGGTVRITHSPTNRRVKGTDDIIAAVNELSRWHSIELDLIERREWVVSLSRKGRADIFVDQLYLGIGNAAIEAMAMGVPVVAGFAEPSDEARWLQVTGEKVLPFHAATTADVGERLRELVESDELREEVGARGRAYVERWHSEEFVVRQLKAVYEQTPKSHGVRTLKLYTARVLPALTAQKPQREAIRAAG